MLSDGQRRALLRTARESIESHLNGHRPAALSGEPWPPASGVFVTLKQQGQLRGCLGVLRMHGTLVEEVARCARDSATQDPRFPPLSPVELPNTSLEISVLGPIEPIDPLDPSSFEIGTHGLVVEQGGRRGLLLPQVAGEWGWTRDQFLSQTCRKAGLDEGCWRDGARVFRFTAEVFGE